MGAKAKNVTPEKKAQGWGDTWTWTGLDADTKLCVTYLVGGRSAGWAFGADIDYAMLQKIYGAPSDAEMRRYSPAKCIGSDMKVVSGDPDPKHVSTSYVERHNLTMRTGMRSFTRLTNGFSKKFENHAAMVAIHAVYYNFARIHKTLRIAPAMAAGLSDHVWTLEEIVMMARQLRAKSEKRGPYKKTRNAELK